MARRKMTPAEVSSLKPSALHSDNNPTLTADATHFGNMRGQSEPPAWSADISRLNAVVLELQQNQAPTSSVAHERTAELASSYDLAEQIVSARLEHETAIKQVYEIVLGLQQSLANTSALVSEIQTQIKNLDSLPDTYSDRITKIESILAEMQNHIAL